MRFGSIPKHSDFLIVHSSVPGTYSWSNSSEGSWFIKNLCAELDTNAMKYDFITLLTFVNQRVSRELNHYAVENPDASMKVPCFTTLLTRPLKFN
jgi:hypothetical protein